MDGMKEFESIKSNRLINRVIIPRFSPNFWAMDHDLIILAWFNECRRVSMPFATDGKVKIARSGLLKLFDESPESAVLVLI